MSDTTKPEVGAGDVSITLLDQEYTLVPTPAAAQNISRAAGGLRTAIENVMKLDMDLVASVVRYGVGPKVAQQMGGPEGIFDKVFKSGLTDESSGQLVLKCVNFLTILTNGGRPLKKVEGDDEPERPRTA